MKASLRSVRIAPKKANLVAKMVRGLPVEEARDVLLHTNKKAARLLDELIKSAVANATNNENQLVSGLIVKTIVVNKAQAFHRGVPMARGRVRPMRKFLSHIHVTLGVLQDEEDVSSSKKETVKNEKEKSTKASQTTKTPVKSEAAKGSKGKSTSKKDDTETTSSNSLSAVAAKTSVKATSSSKK